MNSEYGSYTKNYNLLKPDDKDFYDIEHINGNMDIVDEELDKLNQKTMQLDETVADISGLIGVKTDTGGTNTEGTVMAKLNALLSKVSSGVGIKSVQRGSFVEDFNVETVKTTRINISTVNPQKTFVIINGGLSAGYSNSSSAVRGYVGTVASTYFNYCAGRASLTIGAGTVGYQVIEFY